MRRNIILRRIHMYLGLFLFVFFLKYGVSAIPFAHAPFFAKFYEGQQMWTVREEKPFHYEIADDTDMRELGQAVMDSCGFTGHFGAYRVGSNRINVHHHTFWTDVRVAYIIDESIIRIEDKTFRWDHYLHKYHWLGGYQQSRFLNDLWAFMIDMVCVGIIVWVATGLMMWWRDAKHHTWGLLTMLAGTAVFFAIVLNL